MLSSPMLWLVLAAAQGVVATQPAGAPATDPKPGTANPPASIAGPPADLGALKVPDDAILIVVEKAADALRMVPSAVVLTAEKYQELLAENDRLRKGARADRPAAPSRCELVSQGKIENGVLTLQAHFVFTTDRPQAAVRLGCRQARADEVVLDDGRKPLLRSDPTEGFTVTVDKPGLHDLRLGLSLALATRGTRQGVELDLPRAAITKLDLELPAGSRDLRLGPDATPLRDPLLVLKDNVLKGSLPSSADRLDLTWAGPSVGRGALTVHGRVRVRVDEQQTLTDAELQMERQGGEADAWKVLVPVGSVVKLPAGQEDRLAGIDVDDKAYGPFASLQTVRLKSPATALKVLVSARGPQIRPGVPAPVGPFAAPEATRQDGTLLVSNAAPGLRLELQRRGDLARDAPRPDEARDDPTLVAVFRYSGVPLPEKPLATTGAGSLSLLDVEVEAVRGVVEARAIHALQLARDATGARRWRLKTRIEATPVRAGVEQLHVQLPAGFRYAADAGAADPVVRSVDWNQQLNVLTFRLNGSESKGFTLSLEGDYAAAVSDAGRATLGLPVPREARDLGGQVTLTAPDDLEFLPVEHGNPGLEATARDGQSQAWRAPRFPDRVEVAWRAYRPQLQVASEVDLTLTPGEGLVRHALRFHFPRTAPDQIALHVPPAVASSLRVLRGGSLAPREVLRPGSRVIDLRSFGDPPPGKDVTVVVEYSFSRTDGATPGAPLQIPLIQPEMAARGDTKVRVWAEPGAAPLPPGGAWTEQGIEEVQGQDRLPALVLRAQRLDAPLSLPLALPEGPTISVLTERALVRASITESGGQAYRVSFLLERLESRYLDVELPAVTAGLGLRVALDGKQVSWEPVDDDGRRAAGGRIARLRLGSQLVRRGSVLEVAYELQAGRAATGLLQTTLNPPVLRGDPGRVPTRWLVQLPAGWVPIGPEGGPGQERVWTRRSWLFVPRPTVTDLELERWLAGPDAAASPGTDETAVPSLTCWRDRPEPLRLVHAPQLGWLLACSLGALGVGLGLFALAGAGADLAPARWLLPGLAILGAGLAAASLFWPGAMAAIAYGAEPGLAGLAIVIPLFWLHERQRQRNAFPATFSRAKAVSQSSLLRANGARPAGEPSTVDVPRPSGNPPRSSPDLPRLEGSAPGKAGRESTGSGGRGS